MATLTGFKSFNGESGQAATNAGQQNPVFVFDEVNVGDGAATESDTNNEEFADASSSVHESSSQDPKVTKSSGTNIDNNSSSSKSSNSSTTSSNSNSNNCNSEASKNKPQVSSVAIDMQTVKGPQTPPGKPKKAAAAESANQTNGTKRPQRPIMGNSLNPNKPDEGDNVSVSMLAIDCAGTGKSPRQPRRSPLMALFRGKPRESVRRTYTDVDQFEIEWANLCLEVQRKWYHGLGLHSLMGGHNGDSNDRELIAASDNNTTSSKTRPKLILNAVDGRIRSGEITAVLGPSGAGKTSLLNSLFGKYRTAVQGSVRVTGAPSKKHLTVCTIPQSDYLIGYLTTEEALWFASRLKNCEDDFNHDRNIERVIELLGLQRCRHTRINKLSGGQYKRVSIAQEMLSSPDILVLDEPTSGLDSLTCYRTVKVLRDLVEASKAHNLVNPMSIILTIHQPHQEVLDLFHSVYVMAVGGMTLFQGPPGEMEAAINKHSGVQMPAEGYNPASFMVEIASEEYGRQPIEALVVKQRERFKETTQHTYNYDFSSAGLQQQQAINAIGQLEAAKLQSSVGIKGESTISLYPLDAKETAGNGTGVNSKGNELERDIDSRIMTPRSGKNSDGVFWRHVGLMSKRCLLSNTRDPLLCTIRVGAHIFIPFVVALIYGPRMGIPNGCPFYKPEINLLEYASMGVEEIQEKHDDIRIQFQNVGLHFMMYYAFGLCMLAFTAISFPLIMHVLIKEIRNGWYSLATFILGKMIAELPMAILLPPISVGIIYYMTGQPSSYLQWRYMVQSLLLVLIIMIAEAKGLIFGAICMNSMQTAVFAASVSTVPFILLSGFLIRIREVPYVLQHLARFSYFKHSVEALIITRYGYGMCPCDPALIPPGGTPRIIGIPPQIMSLTDYYINAFVDSTDNSTNTETTTTETNVVGNNRHVDRIIEAATTLAPEIESMPEATTSTTKRPSAGPRRNRRHQSEPETTTVVQPNASADVESETERPGKQGIFFDKLAALLTRANAFGYSITSCDDVEPFTMKDMLLKDHMLPPIIGYMFLYIVILKFISYFIVEICVKLKL